MINKSRSDLQNENRALEAEIERLSIVTEGQLSEITRLRARVEKLGNHKCECGVSRDPNELCETRAMLFCMVPGGASEENLAKHTTDLILALGHHITDEQIDAAWEYITHTTNRLAATQVERALNKLHIFRCEGCEGDGQIQHTNIDVIGSELIEVWDCPDCNGKGYTVGKPDEK